MERKDYYCKKKLITFEDIDPKTFKLQIHPQCAKLCGLDRNIIDCISENVEVKELCQPNNGQYG